MINNYVKNGLIPPPKGKKYGRRHIAYIFVVFFLKQIFSLEEVKLFIQMEINTSNERDAYNSFCGALECELKKFVAENTPEFAASKVLKNATQSIAHKLYSQHLLREYISKQKHNC